MSLQTSEEERYHLKEFRFPKKNNENDITAMCSTSRHRQLGVKNMKDENPESSSLFQQLSEYRMNFVPNHCRRRHERHQCHQRRESISDTLWQEEIGQRKSVSPLRQGDRRTPLSENAYVYHSPKETIRNFNEQMERNFHGRYGSLEEFADDNKLEVGSKVFATWKEPQIDLEQGLEDAMRATKIE